MIHDKEFREYIKKENKYHDLLMKNPRFKPQGIDKNFKKVVVAIIQGNVNEYKPGDFHEFEAFESWEEAYLKLSEKYKDK